MHPRRSFGFRSRSGVVSVVTCVLLVVPAASDREATADPPGDAVRPTEIAAPTSIAALRAALEAYEASLPDMAWQQTMQQIPDKSNTRPDESDPNPERKVATWHAEMAFARHGRWCATVRRGSQRDSYYFDGNWIYARGVDANTRVVRAHETEAHQYLLSPLMLVTGGQYAGGVSPFLRMLSEKLAGLEEIEVDDSANPLVRIIGSHKPGDKWQQLEVTLDAERGFMPTSIVEIDEMSGVVREEFRVTAAERVGQAWIPSEGTRKSTTLKATKYLNALSTNTEEAAKLTEVYDAWRAASKLDPTKRADRVRLREKMASLVGGPLFEGVPVAGYGRDTLRAWNFRVLDDALAAELLKPPFDEGDKVFDSRTREICYWRGGKLVKEDGTPVVLDAAAAAKPAASEPKPASPSPPPQPPPEATPAPKPQAENAKP